MISTKSGHCLITLLTENVVLINVYLRSVLSLKNMHYFLVFFRRARRIRDTRVGGRRETYTSPDSPLARFAFVFALVKTKNNTSIFFILKETFVVTSIT